MATTLEALAERVAVLENRLTAMEQHEEQNPRVPQMPPRFQNIPLFREAYLQQATIDAVTTEVFRKMGIPEAPPLSFEEFTKLRDAIPLPPEEEWASREVMRMREE